MTACWKTLPVMLACWKWVVVAGSGGTDGCKVAVVVVLMDVNGINVGSE